MYHLVCFCVKSVPRYGSSFMSQLFTDEVEVVLLGFVSDQTASSIFLTPADVKSQKTKIRMTKKFPDLWGVFIFHLLPVKLLCSLNKRRSFSCSSMNVCELQLCSSVFIPLSLIFTASSGSSSSNTLPIISFLVSKRQSRNVAKLFSRRFWLTRYKGERRRLRDEGEEDEEEMGKWVKGAHSR